MSKKKDKDIEPAWMDPSNDRKAPYTEEELDLFVEGFIDNHKSQWTNLVSEMGEEKGKKMVKDGFRKMDENHISNIGADNTSLN